MTTVTESTPMPMPEEAHASGGDSRALTISWHHLTLGAILVLAGFLNFWNLGRLGYGNTYYAAAVRSMTENWHNFFFNSFDPGGFVTIDKPPLGFWFQVISTKVFGFNGFSLILPSALAGMLSVLLLYHLVERVFGRAAGLLAALAMAVTPVAVATNRSNIIDSVLVLFMLAPARAKPRTALAREEAGPVRAVVKPRRVSVQAKRNQAYRPTRDRAVGRGSSMALPYPANLRPELGKTPSAQEGGVDSDRAVASRPIAPLIEQAVA